jgi:ABC-type dipeptide/oligopeptide/nickel transport system permease subunit
MLGYHPWNLPALAPCWIRQEIEEDNREGGAMSGELGGKFGQVLKGRNLIILAVTDVVLFLIANIAYGGGNQHGLRNNVSNVTWAVFLVGFLLLVVLGIASIARAMRRRAKVHA